MSTITIYKTSRIIPGRNLKIDDLETYLSTISSLSFSDFQYIRPKLDGTIKVNLGQEYAFWDSFVFDYLKVVNGNGEKTQYYFITKVEQKSESTLELTLHMDVINTFQGAYEISPNSVIKREFKDRYEMLVNYDTGEHSVSINSQTDDYFYKPVYDAFYKTVSCTVKDKFFEDYPDARINDSRLLLSDGTYMSALSCSGSSTVTATFSGGFGLKVSAIIWYFKYNIERTFYPIIDYLSEGIEPQLYKDQELQINQFDDQSWNLVYRGQATMSATEYNYISAVDVFLCPDVTTPVKYVNESGRVKKATDFTTAKYTYFRHEVSGILEVRITHEDDKTETLMLTDDLVREVWGSTFYIPVDGYVYSDGNYLTIYRRSYDSVLGYKKYGSTISQLKSIEFITNKESVSYGLLDAIPSSRPDASILTKTLTLGDYAFKTASGVQTIGLTDSRLMKIIKLPYPPANGSIDADGNVSFDNWAYSESEGMYKGSVAGTAYINRMETADFSPLYLALGISASPGETEVDDKKSAWSKRFETKLYHSDFYQPKFVYDSFTFLFECEKVDRKAWREITNKELLHMDFVVTSTVNSRFLFRFPDYVLEKSQSDYDNVLPVSRNNEVTIYSNQYINYLRTGYNYDVKNKNRQQAMSALNIVGATPNVVDYGVGYKYGEIDHPGASLFGTAVGAIGKITSNIMAINQAEEALERKKRTMVNQATSVSGSDDIDLLVAYSNNQAKLVYYRPSELMANALATLFHYCGYISERRGVPNENTRYWFDYCQADIEFINEKHAPSWALDEIKMRYSLGITILHNHSSEWDINQEYENWEVSFDL